MHRSTRRKRQPRQIRRDAIEFRERYILPNIEEIEHRAAEKPDSFPYDVLREGTPYRFPTLIMLDGMGVRD